MGLIEFDQVVLVQLEWINRLFAPGWIRLGQGSRRRLPPCGSTSDKRPLGAGSLEGWEWSWDMLGYCIKASKVGKPHEHHG